MKYLRFNEITEFGYYWWLPPYLEDKPEVEANWSIISIPPGEVNQKRGVFYGPLLSPIFKVL